MINEYDTIVIQRAIDLCVIGAAFRCIDSKAKKCRVISIQFVLEYIVCIAREEKRRLEKHD